MRALHMIRYHWRRRWRLTLLLAALMLVVSTATLLYVRAEYATSMVVFQGGIAHVEHGYGTVNMSFNYSLLFTILTWIAAVRVLATERAFFVTASASRREFVLSLAGFVVLYALAMTGINWLIGVVNRLEMPLLGMRVRNALTPQLALTGGNPTFLYDLVRTFTGMLAASGWACLVYALFARWWKVILILFGAGIVVMLVLGVQVSLGAYTQSMADAARAFVEWVEDYFIPVVVPKIEAFFAERRLWVLSLRDLIQFAVGMLLVYPVILRLKVKN